MTNNYVYRIQDNWSINNLVIQLSYPIRNWRISNAFILGGIPSDILNKEKLSYRSNSNLCESNIILRTPQGSGDTKSKL